MLKYSLGIDISKADFHSCISTIDIHQRVRIKGSRTFSNNLKGFKELHAWVTKHRKEADIPLVVVMEATGSYHEQLALFLSEKDYYLSVVLPNRAKNYLKYLGAKSKNDSIDARGLAQMGAEQNLKEWSPMSKYFYILRSLTRQRQNYQELATVINNQIKAASFSMYKDRKLINQQESLLRKFEKYIDDLEQRIKEYIASDQEVKQRIDNICEISGVSLLTVATIVSETNGFELFTNRRQVVSYAGYDVVENQSGRHTGKTRISKQGNGRLRRCLHMPALNVVKYKQTPFIGLYERVFERTKIKMKGYVAVQKKLLIIIYTLWKQNEPYLKNYIPKEYTGEKEQESPSLHGLEQANSSSDSNFKKSSTNQKIDATQGQHTVEKSQSVASLQLQI